MSGEAGGCKCGCDGGASPVLAVPTSTAPAERRVLDVRGLEPPEPFDRTLHVRAVGQSARKIIKAQGPGGGEEQGLDPALGLRRIGRFSDLVPPRHAEAPDRRLR